MSERPDIEAIRRRAEAATPGPWLWFGNLDTRRVQLVTLTGRFPGWDTVMGFARWGFKGAAPQFSDGHGGIHRIDEPGWVKFQVCSDCETREDERVYRADFVAIRHPDAEFIANARQDVEVLLAYIAQLEASRA